MRPQHYKPYSLPPGSTDNKGHRYLQGHGANLKILFTAVIYGCLDKASVFSWQTFSA